MTAKMKAQIESELKTTQAELEALREAVKREVLQYPDGCMQGKIDFLKSVGIDDANPKTNGVVKVSLEVEWNNTDDRYIEDIDDIVREAVESWLSDGDSHSYWSNDLQEWVTLDLTSFNVRIDLLD